MYITLHTVDGKLIAKTPILVDDDGYFYLDPTSHEFDFDCALYGYQEGGVSTDTIEDDDGKVIMKWTVITPDGNIAPQL
jgi:hypothetical protein